MQPNLTDFSPTVGNAPPTLGNMPAPKKPTTFDAHLGTLIANLADDKGGRPFVASVLGVSLKTIDRRVLGDGSYTVKEVNLIADALHMTYDEIVNLALRKYADGSREDGIRKLIAAEGVHLVSEPPVSLDQHRKKKPSEMTDEELEGVPSAANTDPEIGHDEPDPA